MPVSCDRIWRASSHSRTRVRIRPAERMAACAREWVMLPLALVSTPAGPASVQTWLSRNAGRSNRAVSMAIRLPPPNSPVSRK